MQIVSLDPVDNKTDFFRIESEVSFGLSELDSDFVNNEQMLIGMSRSVGGRLERASSSTAVNKSRARFALIWNSLTKPQFC